MDYLKALENAIIFIENNLENEITAAEAANAAAYSYYHFHRIFEAVLGETIGNYIRSRRLSKAAKELIYSDRRIIDIALSLRFESQEAFSRAFKKYYHVTPNAYRKNRIDMLLGSRQQLLPDLQHIIHNIKNQPEIMEVNGMKLIGFRFPVSIADNSCEIYWRKLTERLGEIKHPVPGSFRYGMFEFDHKNSCSFLNEDFVTNEFIGIRVSSFGFVPEDMAVKNFPGGKYAKFTHCGTAKTIIKTYRYIWGTWIPYCGYELDDRDDLECYTEQFLGENNESSRIDIYIPIK